MMGVKADVVGAIRQVPIDSRWPRRYTEDVRAHFDTTEERVHMKANVAWLIAGLLVLGGFSGAVAAGLAEKVKVEVDASERQPGMYVCAGGHLHIKGTVQNLADVPLGRIKVVGKAFDSAGKLLGTATVAAAKSTLKPGEKAPFDLEFVSVSGPRIQQVKKREITVVDAPPVAR